MVKGTVVKPPTRFEDVENDKVNNNGQHSIHDKAPAMGSKNKGKRSIHDKLQANQESYKRAKDRRWAEEDQGGLNTARLRRRTAAAKRDKDLTGREVYSLMKDKEAKQGMKTTTEQAEKMKSDGKIKDIRSYFK